MQVDQDVRSELDPDGVRVVTVERRIVRVFFFAQRRRRAAREELRERDALSVDLRERMNESREAETQTTPVIRDAERDHHGSRMRHALCSCLGSSSDTSWAIGNRRATETPQRTP